MGRAKDHHCPHKEQEDRWELLLGGRVQELACVKFLILLGSALVYTKGSQKSKGRGGTQNSPIKKGKEPGEKIATKTDRPMKKEMGGAKRFLHRRPKSYKKWIQVTGNVARPLARGLCNSGLAGVLQGEFNSSKTWQ